MPLTGRWVLSETDSPSPLGTISSPRSFTSGKWIYLNGSGLTQFLHVKWLPSEGRGRLPRAGTKTLLTSWNAAPIQRGPARRVAAR